MSKKPVVGIIMGSTSDMKTMSAAIEVMKDFGVAHEVKIVSAHRTPKDMVEYGEKAAARGLKVIIAGAGGAAHLPGMIASVTTLPVIGVPVLIGKLKGLDALLSIAQMPKGVPVACMAVDNAFNAGLLAARMLGAYDSKITKKLEAFQKASAKKVRAANKK